MKGHCREDGSWFEAVHNLWVRYRIKGLYAKINLGLAMEVVARYACYQSSKIDLLGILKFLNFLWFFNAVKYLLSQEGYLHGKI